MEAALFFRNNTGKEEQFFIVMAIKQSPVLWLSGAI
jgi:hypothetical protein